MSHIYRWLYLRVASAHTATIDYTKNGVLPQRCRCFDVGLCDRPPVQSKTTPNEGVVIEEPLRGRHCWGGVPTDTRHGPCWRTCHLSRQLQHPLPIPTPFVLVLLFFLPFTCVVIQYTCQKCCQEFAMCHSDISNKLLSSGLRTQLFVIASITLYFE